MLNRPLQSKSQDMLLLNTRETPLEELLTQKLPSNSHLEESLLVSPLVLANQAEPMVIFLKEKNLSSTKRN